MALASSSAFGLSVVVVVERGMSTARKRSWEGGMWWAGLLVLVRKGEAAWRAAVGMVSGWVKRVRVWEVGRRRWGCRAVVSCG